MTPSLDLDSLRRHLAQRDRHRIAEPALRASAVLVPLLLKEAGPHLVLTKRSARMSSHASQICFPGGCVEPTDADLLATALRESQEEVGIAPEDVDVLGPLDDTMTLGRFRITPFLGVIPDPYPFRVDVTEVDRLIEVPLAYFLDPARVRVERMPFPDGALHPVHFYSVGEEVVWGATARIIHEWLSWMGGLGSPGA